MTRVGLDATVGIDSNFVWSGKEGRSASQLKRRDCVDVEDFWIWVKNCVVGFVIVEGYRKVGTKKTCNQHRVAYFAIFLRCVRMNR